MMVGPDFFDAMFTHDMEEKLSGVVEMRHMSSRIFGKCVEFIYTGDISLVVEECEELLFAAGMLQLTLVCNNIAPFLQSQLSPSSFFTTKRIADKFSLCNLKKVCDQYALANLDKIVKEKEFDDLEKEYISFLITTKKSVGHKSENSKMAIILQWIKADVENRNHYLIDLATLVDFSRITPGLVKHLALDEKVCSESLQFIKMLLFASINHSSVKKESPEVSFESSKQSSLVVFDHSASVLKAYNQNANNWTKMQELHEEMTHSHNYTAVVMDNFIYVLLRNKKAKRLNPEVKDSKWESIPNMIQEHRAPVAAVCGEDIYVAGSHSMERYSTRESRWREVNCHGISNCNCCALVVYNNFIYAIGGFNGGDLAEVNRFSILTSSWSSLSLMPNQIQYPAATIHDDKIYVAGGLCRNREVNNFMSYDPKIDTWIQLSPMTRSRFYFKLCILANELYAVGSHMSGCSIEMYDFEKKKWNAVTDEDGKMKINAPATVAIELPGS